MSSLGKTTGRASQKRSKGETGARPDRRDTPGRFGLQGIGLQGLGLNGAHLAGAAVAGAAGFAGAVAGRFVNLKHFGKGMAPVVDGADPAALPAGASSPAAGGISLAAGGIGVSSPPIPACGQGGGCAAAPAPDPFAAAAPFSAGGQLKRGAVRAFLRARYGGPKPQFAIAADTGVPADTIRKAIAHGEVSELSGPHLMRLVAVFGPAFVAAVMEPAPDWAKGGKP